MTGRNAEKGEYDYDAAGNRLTETEGASAFVYTPNPLDQCTSRTGANGSATFVHDADGNLTSAIREGEQTTYLAKRIATARGGELSVETQSGKGTQFTLRLPCHRDRDSAMTAE